MENICNEIEYVVDNSKYVKINYKKLDEFISNFGELDYKHWFSEFDLYFSEKEKILLAFLIESINFCFWQKPKYKILYKNNELKGSEALFYRFIELVTKNKEFLDISKLNMMTIDDFSNFFKGYNSELPLFEERYNILKDTVNVIYKKGDNFYKELFAQKSDIELLNYIVSNFKYFDDSSNYKDVIVHFYKRVTLLVNDLFYMSETIHNNIKNVDNLGGCADYGVPRTLRTYGILEYNEELANLVDNEIEIKHNSEMEIEIRANMLYVIEFAKNKLNSTGKKVNSIQLDNLIWQMGRKKQNILPYHHTVTIFY